MPNNELNPQEIKALKRFVKYERASWKITGISCVVFFAVIIIGSIVITALLMYLLSIPLDGEILKTQLMP